MHLRSLSKGSSATRGCDAASAALRIPSRAAYSTSAHSVASPFAVPSGSSCASVQRVIAVASSFWGP